MENVGGSGISRDQRDLGMALTFAGEVFGHIVGVKARIA